MSMVVELENIDFETLENITNNVSVGDGGYSTVHKGVHNGKMVAVKLLREGVSNEKIEKLFENEIKMLSRVEHRNVIRLIGTCNRSRKEHMEQNGRSHLVDKSYRALCFEYMECGDLDKHLFEESRGHDWVTRYKIIRGICDGLHSLHGSSPSIFHLDLKPANILLDGSGVPRIADFGLSTLSTETDTYTKETHRGTFGYIPPEAYMEQPQVTEKYDIYSLGVIIIQIIAGRNGRKELSNTSPSYFLDRVVTNWRNRDETTETDLAQVGRCIRLGIRCIDAEMINRPTAARVVDILNRGITLGLPQQQEETSTETTTALAAPRPSPRGEPGISMFVGVPWSPDMVELKPKGSSSSTPPPPPAPQLSPMELFGRGGRMMRPSERKKQEEENPSRFKHKYSVNNPPGMPRLGRK